jgi:hypothetical protein
MRRHSQTALNRKRKMAQAPAPRELHLLDFILKRRDKSKGPAAKVMKVSMKQVGFVLFAFTASSRRLAWLVQWLAHSDGKISGLNPGFGTDHIISPITNNWFASVNIKLAATPNMLRCLCA